jgi:gas vesicle protein
VGAFWAWSPAIQKRCEEGDEIGPNFDAVSKQIQEMKVIQAQAVQMSFSGLLDPYKSNNILEFLTADEETNLRKANEEWIKLKNWVDKRLEVLQKSDDIWEDFKARKLDLVEYLRDIENELKKVMGIDLNDRESVETRTAGCVTVTSGMESRKDHVAYLMDTADKLINLLVSADNRAEHENSLPNSIRSQVADILDSWNSMVKRSIELKSKLNTCTKKFDSCNTLYGEVRGWVDDCTNILSQFLTDTGGEHIDKLRLSLEKKQNEEARYRDKLQDVNDLDDELSRDGDICPTYELPGKVKDLNHDFTNACEKLAELNKFTGKVKIMSRLAASGSTKMARGARDGSTKMARGALEGSTKMARGARDGTSKLARGARDGTTRLTRNIGSAMNAPLN